MVGVAINEVLDGTRQVFVLVYVVVWKSLTN